MSLNPVQFGTEVIDQFGRYLMTNFPIADPPWVLALRICMCINVLSSLLVDRAMQRLKPRPKNKS